MDALKQLHLFSAEKMDFTGLNHADFLAMILEGKIHAKGVHIRVIPEIYNPILDRLEGLDIKMVEEYGLPESENIK